LEIGLGLIHGFSTTKITKGHEKEEDLSRPLLVFFVHLVDFQVLERG